MPNRDRFRCHFATEQNGKKHELIRASSTPIERHVKIRSEANPYDLRWETYFERRQDQRWLNSLNGKKKVAAIWKKQNRLCPACEQRFTPETGWNVHHIVKKTLGGGDELENLALLHPNCHRQLHSNEAGTPQKEHLSKA